MPPGHSEALLTNKMTTISLTGILFARDSIEADKTLFYPVNGRSADGFIVRKLKRGVKLRFRSETYKPFFPMAVNGTATAAR